MPLIEGEIHTLASAASFCELALLLAGAAVVFVGRQIHALVVATRRVFALSLTDGVIFVAVIRGSRVLHFCEKPAAPFSWENDGVFMSGESMLEWGVVNHFADVLHGESDSDGHCYGDCEDDFDEFH